VADVVLCSITLTRFRDDGPLQTATCRIVQCNIKGKKGKVIPLQAWCGPEGG